MDATIRQVLSDRVAAGRILAGMTQDLPASSMAHPLARQPVAERLFAELIALMSALGDLVAYGRCGFGREGDGRVDLASWRSTRKHLRAAEGLFRRLLLEPAEALAESLLAAPARRTADDPARRAGQALPGDTAQARGKCPGQPPSPATDGSSRPATGSATGPATNPAIDAATLTRRAPAASGDGGGDDAPPPADPFPRLRLHEGGSGNADRRYRPAAPRLCDVFGTVRRPLAAELARYCALVVAIEQPDRAIYRLARILVRRRRLAAGCAGPQSPDLPFSLEWGLAARHWPGAGIGDWPGLRSTLSDWMVARGSGDGRARDGP